jgi:ferredoxin
MDGDLTIDRDRCMGSGQCTYYAPGTFDLDDMSIAVVVDQHGDCDEKIQTAISVCPTRSISRVRTQETNGGTQ